MQSSASIGQPRAALVIERDLATRKAAAGDIPVRVTPLVWNGSRWRHHHVQISSGSLVQIGTMDDALPGVNAMGSSRAIGTRRAIFSAG